MNNSVLNQIHKVRLRQGLSLTHVAKQLKMDVAKARVQENESTDLRISDLRRWRDVLKVPISELLVESGRELSPLVMERARLVRVMKTAVTIAERAQSVEVDRLVENLIGQINEIMPSLKDVAPWPHVGQRRTGADLGRISENPLPDDYWRREIY